MEPLAGASRPREKLAGGVTVLTARWFADTAGDRAGLQEHCSRNEREDAGLGRALQMKRW